MKAFLRSLLNFLERKFPDKVVVTENNYRQLVDSQKGQAAQIVELKAKLVQLEINVANINHAMGNAIPRLGMLER